MTETKSRRHFMRYSIAAILLLAACVAGMLAGYRNGFESGYANGMEKRFAEQPLVKIYELEPVLNGFDISDSELKDAGVGRLDLLFSAIETTIEPDSWESLGGGGTMQPMGEHAIAVNQKPYVQGQIANLLDNPERAEQAMNYALEEFTRMAKFRQSAQGIGTTEMPNSNQEDAMNGEPSVAHEGTESKSNE